MPTISKAIELMPGIIFVLRARCHPRADFGVKGNHLVQYLAAHVPRRNGNQMVRWTSISVTKLPPARKGIGCRPSDRFELLFRLYAPTKNLFDKKWVLPDVEKVAA